MRPVVWAVAAVVGAAVVALVVVQIVHVIVARLGRRSALLADLSRQAHRPFQVSLTLYAVQQAVRTAAGDFPGRGALLHALVLAVIASVAWLVAALLLVLEDVALARWRTDVPDNLRARKLHTQVVMLRRVTVAAIVVLALAVMLMTFPPVRTIGTSLLASAGIVGVVAAIAAQSTLSNLFAGLQLAFSDAVRIDDVVVVEGEWGRVEELTLSYVVVHIWDDRRLIMPTSYFTSKAFQNWTRTGSAVLGTAEFDVDWSVRVEEVREELRRLCEGTDLWDGRVCVLQMTDATGGRVQLRALVSAHDAGSLWDLRCLVREHLVAWVRDHQPTALPRWRAELAGSRGEDFAWHGGEKARPQTGRVRPAPGRRQDEPTDDARVFGGSDDGTARGTVFGGSDDGTARGTVFGAGDETVARGVVAIGREGPPDPARP